MVFCRGCGKEIHETAPACPACGAPQVGLKQPQLERSVGKLIGWGFVWTCVFWFVAIFTVGFFAGIADPGNAEAAGARLGASLSGPFFLVALLLSGLLVYLGKLPGTRK
jgi:hypothetical protein